jgi:hypothetical protein
LSSIILLYLKLKRRVRLESIEVEIW